MSIPPLPVSSQWEGRQTLHSEVHLVLSRLFHSATGHNAHAPLPFVLRGRSEAVDDETGTDHLFGSFPVWLLILIRPASVSVLTLQALVPHSNVLSALRAVRNLRGK